MAMQNLAEVLIKNYPKTATLEDGTPVILRPLVKADEQALLEYFQKMPGEDRLCLKEDVTDARVIENWIYNLDYNSVLPLIALYNGKIVGDATLNFSPIGWTRHQGEIRLTTDPHYRAKGLGSILVQNLMDTAANLGLEQLSAEIPPVLDKAFSLFEKMGFEKVAVLQGFVRDLQGQESDLILMIKSLSKP